MSVNLAAAAKQVKAWSDQLLSEYPVVRAKADELADGIIDCRTASAEDIWGKLWDKPIYSARNTQAGQQMAADAAPHMEGAWKTAMLEGPFLISKTPAAHWMSADGYNPSHLLVRFNEEYGIAYHRSFAIMSAGQRLGELAEGNDRPFEYLHGRALEEIVPELQDEFGDGWGHITVLHFLTDLGLACKPDLHIVRTMHALGLFTCKTNDATLPEALEINRLVRQLLPLTYSASTSRRDLRHMDKVLMEISHCEIFPENARDTNLVELALAKKAAKKAKDAAKASALTG